jgi:hypothetical protein
MDRNFAVAKKAQYRVGNSLRPGDDKLTGKEFFEKAYTDFFKSKHLYGYIYMNKGYREEDWLDTGITAFAHSVRVIHNLLHIYSFATDDQGVVRASALPLPWSAEALRTAPPLLVSSSKLTKPAAKKVTERTQLAKQVAAATRALALPKAPFSQFHHLHLHTTLPDGRKWAAITESTALSPRLGVSYAELASALQVILSHARYSGMPERAAWPRSVSGYQQLLGEYELALEMQEEARAAAAKAAGAAAAAAPAPAAAGGDGIKADAAPLAGVGDGDLAGDQESGGESVASDASDASGFAGRNADLRELSQDDDPVAADDPDTE